MVLNKSRQFLVKKLICIHQKIPTEYFITQKCLLQTKKQALKFKYSAVRYIMRMKCFLRKLSLTDSAGFLAYRSLRNLTFSVKYKWHEQIPFPVYSDRIAQDSHLIPSLTDELCSQVHLICYYGIYTRSILALC